MASTWLHAWHDPLADLKTTTSCVRLVDLYGDGDFKLCIATSDKKLRVYKGTSLLLENNLLDVPVSMCACYMDTTQPSLAVATGPYIYIYRQLRPYKKWTCPNVEISPIEGEVWADLACGAISAGVASKRLLAAREGGTVLSGRSAELLSIEGDQARADYVAEIKEAPYFQFDHITLMETIKKEADSVVAVSLLIVGTEAGYLYVLHPDPVISSYLCRVLLPSPPVVATVSGLYDVEWRITVCCRDGRMYHVKNGDSRGTAVLSGSVVDLGGQAVAVGRHDKNYAVATMDRALASYSIKGRRVKTLATAGDIADFCFISVKKAKVDMLLLLALSSGEIQLFYESALINAFLVEPPVVAVRFGQYGREDSTLIIVHGRGSLTIKIWRRSSVVDGLGGAAGPPPEQDIPLPIPKKTKLYLEQTAREVEQAADMHRAFQRDLVRLRLETTRAYAKTLGDAPRPAAGGETTPDIRVHAQVQGLGPKFLLKISLQNMGVRPLMGATLFFTFDTKCYALASPAVAIPALLPGPRQVVEVILCSVDPQGRAGQVTAMLCRSGRRGECLPIVAANIKMPASELSLM